MSVLRREEHILALRWQVSRSQSANETPSNMIDLGAFIAQSLGPTLGGIFARFASWKWTFWFLAIFSGVFLLAYAFVVPETRQVTRERPLSHHKLRPSRAAENDQSHELPGSSSGTISKWRNLLGFLPTILRRKPLHHRSLLDRDHSHPGSWTACEIAAAPASIIHHQDTPPLMPDAESCVCQ